MKKTTEIKPARVSVSVGVLQRAAARLLSNATVLVSPEILYLQRVLGPKCTQVEIDENVVAVRKLPWSKIAPADSW